MLLVDMRKLSYPPIWLLFEQGRVQVAAGVSFAVGAGGCCGLACGQVPPMPDARPRRRLRLPRHRPWSCPRDFWGVSQEMGADFAMVLDFCAVFGGGCSPLAPPTWGNAGVLRRFRPIRPAKPSRSCKWGSRASEVAHFDTCSDSVGAGRHSRMSKHLKSTGVQRCLRLK